jgi:hypothetical protein
VDGGGESNSTLEFQQFLILKVDQTSLTFARESVFHYIRMHQHKNVPISYLNKHKIIKIQCDGKFCFTKNVN